MTSRLRSTPMPAARLLTILAILALAVSLLPGAAAAQVAPPGSGEDNSAKGDTRRLSGPSRFDTAAAIFNEAFPNGAEVAVVARGDTFPDALAGAYLAGLQDAPILLVSSDSIPEPTDRALNKISQKVFLLGGTGAISPAVQAQLESSGLAVERIAGVSRYDTARRIATSGENAAGVFQDQNARDERFLPRRTAFLATGDGFADALAAGPFAFAGRHPVILTRPDTLSDEARAVLQDETLRIEQVIIVGGRTAVSVRVEEQTKEVVGIVTRVAGTSRTETARKLAELFIEQPFSSPDPSAVRYTYTDMNLALGQNFPDALALGPRGGKNRTPIVLSQTPDLLGQVTESFIAKQCAKVARVIVAGGHAAIAPETEAAAGQAAICGAPTAFSVTPADYVRIAGEEHRLVAVVRDGQGNPLADEIVRIDVYRREAPEGTPGQLTALQPPDHSQTKRTNAQGIAEFTYAYEPSATSPVDAADRIVACIPAQEQTFSCLFEIERDENTQNARARVDWAIEGFRTALTGDAEVPGPGDPEAEGTAVVWFPQVPEGEAPRLCYMIDITGLDELATAAHIHRAPADESGPIAVTLKTPNSDGFAKDCAASNAFTGGMTVANRIKDIKDNPELYYVNVHNDAFPDGAVRGQLE